MSWDKAQYSIPQPEVIWFGGYNFTELSHMSWKKKDNLVTFNIMLLVGTSPASRKDEMNGVDKFKLLGVVTC